MARKYSFGADARPTGRQPGTPTHYRREAGCADATANQGLNIDPGCVATPKLCNWTTLPNAITIPAGTTVLMTTVSPIAQFFDIHAASFVVVNADDATLNGRGLLKSVKFNTRNLEDYDFVGTVVTEGVLLDAAYQFDQGPTSVNWFAGTAGNNQELTHLIQNICAFDVVVHAVFYGNPTDNCPM